MSIVWCLWPADSNEKPSLEREFGNYPHIKCTHTQKTTLHSRVRINKYMHTTNMNLSDVNMQYIFKMLVSFPTRIQFFLPRLHSKIEATQFTTVNIVRILAFILECAKNMFFFSLSYNLLCFSKLNT